MFRSVVRSKAEGRLVKSCIIICSELFSCKTQIPQIFYIKKKKIKFYAVFLMAVEVIVMNKDAF